MAIPSTLRPSLLVLALVATPVYAKNATVDEILVIRTNTTNSTKNQAVRIHRPAGTTPNSIGPTLASDETFNKLSGDLPTRFVFAGDGDGDGVDEVYQVRQQLSAAKDLRLRAFLPPDEFLGSTGPAIASSKKGTLGRASGSAKITAMGCGDISDNAIDEALIIKSAANGTQDLEVRALPHQKNEAMDVVTASILAIDSAVETSIVGVCGVDWDGIGGDEVAILKKSPVGFALEIYRGPTTLGEAPQLLASAPTVPTLGGLEPTSICRMRFDSDAADEIGILLTNSNGVGRYLIYDLPTGPSAGLAAPLFDDNASDPSTDGLSSYAWMTLRGYSFKAPPANIAGTWSGTLKHTVQGQTETIALDHDIIAQQAGSVLTLALPLFNLAQANYVAGANLFTVTTTPVNLDAPGTGTHYALTFGPGIVFAGSGGTFIYGQYVGKKKLPLGQEADVTSGLYLFEAFH